MDQPLFFPENRYPEPGADSGASDGDLAAAVTGMVGDPRAWFARQVIDTDDLDVPAGRALATRVEDIVDQVFTSDPAVEGRLSRSDMAAFAQATSRQMARMEALRAWAMAMLTRDAAYHECDTDWATDDGTGRACPTCTSSADEPACPEQGSPGDDQVGQPTDQRARGFMPGVSPISQVGLEMSAALGMSPTFATTLVDAAVDHVAELPATWACMATGGIDGYKARLIATGTRTLIENITLPHSDPAYAVEVARRERLRAQIQARVLPDAGSKAGEQLRRQIRRLVLRADPHTTRTARQTGTADRRVDRPHTRGDNPAALAGIATMTLTGPVEDLHALHHALDAAARHTRTTERDPRSLDQLRFDTLTSLGWHALRTGHLGYTDPHSHAHGHGDAGAGAGIEAETSAETDVNRDTGTGSAPVGKIAATVGRRSVEIRVTVSLATLLGLDEDPADLEGIGPIPADLAHDLAFGDDATWRRLVTDPLTGALLDYGHRTYRPPAAVDSHIRTRDGTCRFPTTLTTANRADIDHTTPFDHADTHPCPGRSCGRPGGVTAPDNLGVLSRRAHTARTHHHWRLEQPEAGTFTWTSPAAHTYTVDPDPLAEPEIISTPMNDDAPPF